MKKLYTFFLKTYPIWIIIIVLLVTHLGTILSNQGLMVFNTDSYSQSLQFYLGGWQKLKALDFSLWDWSSGYGANYLNHVYYFATSPFFLLTLMVDKWLIPYMFIYLNALKLTLIYAFTFLWLKNLIHQRWISVIGALIITFSGWVTFLYHYNLFLDGFVFYPLVLWSVDRYLSLQKKHLPIFIGLLGIINYYLLYMLIPFVAMYAIMRYFTITKKATFKEFFSRMMGLLLLGLLGVGLSSIILLPSINIILQAPRLSQETSLWETLQGLQVFRYISTLFTPTVAWNDPTYFITISVDQGFGWGGGISLYSFYLSLITLPLVFFIKERRVKWSILGMYGVLTFFASFIVFYKLLQGTIDVRWYYIFLFMNVYTLTYVLNEHLKFSISRMAILMVMVLDFIVLYSLYFVSRYFALADATHLEVLKYIVIYGSILLVSYSFLLIAKSYRWIVIMVVAEACISFLLPLKTNPPIKNSDFKSLYQNELSVSPAIEWIKDTDDGFYRIIRDDLGGFNLNEPFVNQYKGVTFYDSIYNYEMTDFISRFTNKWLMPVVYGRVNTNILTSVKYYVHRDKTNSIPFGFDFLQKIEEDEIFVNRYYLPLGMAVPNDLNLDTFKSLSLYDQDRLWLNTVITPESTNTSIQYLNQPIQLANNDDDGYFSTNDPSVLSNTLITIENKGVPYLTINRHYEDFQNTEAHFQYDYFQTYLDTNKTLQYLEIIASNPYGSSGGINIYAEPDTSYYDRWYDSLTTFDNITIENEVIKARIDIESPTSWVVTSVPYDKGWSVKVDGESIEISKVNLGFIGFELTEGNHELVFQYRPPLFLLGGTLSLLSLLMYCALVVYDQKLFLRSRNRLNEKEHGC